jgi:hypothetical protein
MTAPAADFRAEGISIDRRTSAKYRFTTIPPESRPRDYAGATPHLDRLRAQAFSEKKESVMKHLWITLSIAVLAAVMVSACGGAAKESPAAQATEAAPPASVAEAPAVPPPASTAEPTPAATSGSATASQSGAVYTCPMPEDADVVSDKPGKCPKCGMDLVLKESAGHGTAAGGHSH